MKLIEWPIKGKFIPIPDNWTASTSPTALVANGPLPDLKDWCNRRGQVRFRVAGADPSRLGWMCSRTLWMTHSGSKRTYCNTAQCRANTVLREILQEEL